MSHARVRPPPPYRVHYAPQAWREVGRMSGDAFEALQRELERVAQAPRREEPRDGSPLRHHVEGHGLELLYTRDERTRTLTLLAVSVAR